MSDLCETCKHQDKKWYQEPCDSCTLVDCSYEKKGEKTMKNKIKSIIENPNEFFVYASGVSMLLYTLGYFIRAIKK